MNPNAPNLFQYATKELAQDATLAYILTWAIPVYRESHPRLHKLGLHLLHTLLASKIGEAAVPPATSLDVKTQSDRIDVLVRINDVNENGLVLIVEDKMGADLRPNQIEDYIKKAEQRYPGRQIVPVYVKTGNVSRYKLPAAGKCGWVLRRDLLAVLDRFPDTGDTIIDNFRAHLQEWEDETLGYLEWTRAAGRESWRSWEGFYQRLEEKLDNGTRRGIGWEFVHNRSGGFLGFWWWPSDKDALYLQIEPPTELGKTEARLCFKVEAGPDVEEQMSLQSSWHDRVLAAGGPQVVKPDVMRQGKTMTVAWWKDDWMAFGEDGKLDVNGTIENLKRAEAVLESAFSASS